MFTICLSLPNISLNGKHQQMKPTFMKGLFLIISLQPRILLTDMSYITCRWIWVGTSTSRIRLILPVVSEPEWKITPSMAKTFFTTTTMNYFSFNSLPLSFRGRKKGWLLRKTQNFPKNREQPWNSNAINRKSLYCKSVILTGQPMESASA